MRQTLFAGALLACCSPGAWAQAADGVAIYGVVDAGVTHVDNVAGSAVTTQDSGIFQSSRFGFRGSEDLGGGLRALFTLEAGVNVDTGTNNGLFNRQAYVGLATPAGTLTLGRQYDFLYVTHLPLGMELLVGGMDSGLAGGPGGSAGSIKPIDVHFGGYRYDNSAKWVSTFGPVTVGYMRGLGQEHAVVGSTSRVDSALLHYRSGPFAIGAAWTRDDYNAASSGNGANQVAGVKALYTTGPYSVFLNYAEGKSRNSPARNKPLAAGVLYAATAALDLGVGVGRTRVTNAVGASTAMTQWNLGAMYKLSRRTGAYLLLGSNESDDALVYRGHVGSPGGASAPSSDERQTAVRVGIVHRF